MTKKNTEILYSIEDTISWGLLCRFWNTNVNFITARSEGILRVINLIPTVTPIDIFL